VTELVVVSGKGGTGKTSLVGSLAALARSRVLVDCDVDAADLHLIVPHEVLCSTYFAVSKRAQILDARCTGCGLCLEYCRFDAIWHAKSSIHADQEHYWIARHACEGCGACVRQCPERAINFQEVTSGEWYISDTPYGPMVHARLMIAEANSGRLVSVLRQQARRIAEQQGLDLILVDGPPGIGCPFIASVTGANYVLVVTEPSMSALHDLKRVLELTTHFGIATGICINKSDINPSLSERIREFAGARALPVLAEIPFDPAITEAQLAGVPMVELNTSVATEAIEKLWSGLASRLGAQGEHPTASVTKRKPTTAHVESKA
jgi:MinD superfamily P-loop ATPase